MKVSGFMFNYFEGLKLTGIIVITYCILCILKIAEPSKDNKCEIRNRGIYIYFLIRTRRAKQN